MTDERLQALANNFVDQLKTRFDEKGLNDTGKGRESLSGVGANNKITISGLERVLFLQYGRRPNTDPENWRQIMPFILPWVKRKLNPEPSAVYPIAVSISKKISKFGTDILRDKAKGLQIELIVAELMEIVQNEIAFFEASQMTEQIFNTWTHGTNRN